MRIAFFGSSNFSCSVLDALLDSHHEVSVVVTQPDQPAGRKMKLCPTVVCSRVLQPDFPVLKPEKLINNPGFRRELMAFKPEAFITASYGRIIPSKVLGLTDWPLNVHPSLLPALRGASPIRSALLTGLQTTGCCIMRMTPRLDDGDLMLREELPILPKWNHKQLEDQLGLLGGRQAVEALDAVEAGTAIFTPQNHSQASYCGTFSRCDTVIDWNRPAREIANFIRAWNPEFGAGTMLPDGRGVKIWQAVTDVAPDSECCGNSEATPGTVVCTTKRNIWVATGEGTLRIDELQPQNKKQMPVSSFLAGNNLNTGDSFGVKDC